MICFVFVFVLYEYNEYKTRLKKIIVMKIEKLFYN